MAKTPKKPAKKAADKSKDVTPDDLNIDAGVPDTPQEAAPQAEAAEGVEAGQPMLSVLAQYTKDMSFENPGAPESLRGGLPSPEVNIDIRIGRQINEDNTVEIVLVLRAQAVRGGATVFIAELEYAGLFAFQNMNLEQVQPMMMIECPRIIFPYARKILADMTQDGGFPPIMLDMPDFTAMFRDEMMRRAEGSTVN